VNVNVVKIKKHQNVVVIQTAANALTVVLVVTVVAILIAARAFSS